MTGLIGSGLLNVYFFSFLDLLESIPLMNVLLFRGTGSKSKWLVILWCELDWNNKTR